MGMDLVPRKKGAKRLHYSWNGWGALLDIIELKLPPHMLVQFDGMNDGKLIKAKTCRAVAKIILENKEVYDKVFVFYGENPAETHAELWHNSGGFRQY